MTEYQLKHLLKNELRRKAFGVMGELPQTFTIKMFENVLKAKGIPIYPSFAQTFLGRLVKVKYLSSTVKHDANKNPPTLSVEYSFFRVEPDYHFEIRQSLLLAQQEEFKKVIQSPNSKSKN